MILDNVRLVVNAACIECLLAERNQTVAPTEESEASLASECRSLFECAVPASSIHLLIVLYKGLNKHILNLFQLCCRYRVLLGWQVAVHSIPATIGTRTHTPLLLITISHFQFVMLLNTRLPFIYIWTTYFLSSFQFCSRQAPLNVACLFGAFLGRILVVSSLFSFPGVYK